MGKTIGEVQIINPAARERIEQFYSPSILESAMFVNPRTYKGRGRPRKTDYMTLAESWQFLNSEMEKASGVSIYFK